MMPDLDRETTPPSMLRARVLRTLRAQGLLRPEPRWPRVVVQAAAAVLLFLLGGWAGRATAPEPTPVPASAPVGMTRYVLLLDAGDAFRWDVPEERLVGEYRAWATEQRSVRFARGERLDDLTLVLTAEDAAATPATLAARATPSRVGISGFFVLEAASWEEAVAVARTCPHLRYGGRIILRPVAPT